jgi:hypothetical protein
MSPDYYYLIKNHAKIKNNKNQLIKEILISLQPIFIAIRWI